MEAVHNRKAEIGAACFQREQLIKSEETRWKEVAKNVQQQSATTRARGPLMVFHFDFCLTVRNYLVGCKENNLPEFIESHRSNPKFGTPTTAHHFDGNTFSTPTQMDYPASSMMIRLPSIRSRAPLKIAALYIEYASSDAHNKANPRRHPHLLQTQRGCRRNQAEDSADAGS